MAACSVIPGVSQRGPIETDARAALEDAGLRAGVEAFDTGEGLANSYQLLICAEVADADARDATALAESLAEIFNAVHPVTVDFADHVSAVDVRLVRASAEAADFDEWCRDESSYVPLDSAGELLAAPVSSGWDSVSLETPYEPVALS